MATETVNYILDVDAAGAEKGLDGAGNSAEKTKAELLKLTAAVGAVGTAFVAFQKDVVDMVNNLNDLSVRSGLTTDQIQTLETSFVASGQAAGQAVSLLSRFPAILNSVQRGTGEAAETFARLGVAATDSNGRLRNSGDVFEDLIHKIEDIENPTEKAAAAVGVFGRQGAALVQALGAGEFDDFRDFVREYGLETGPRASAEAAEFQKAIALQRVNFQGLKQDVAELFGGSTGVTKSIAFLTASLRGLFVAFDTFFTSLANSILFAFNVARIGINELALAANKISPIQLVDEKATRATIDRLVTLNIEIAKIEEQQGLTGFAFVDALVKGITTATDTFSAFNEATETAETSVNNVAASMDGLGGKTQTATNNLSQISQELQNLSDFAADPLQFSMQAGLSAATTGSIGGAFSAASPEVAALMGIVSSLEALGQQSPEELRAEMEATTQAIITGIEILPDLLVNVLPPVLAKFTAELALLFQFKLPFILVDALIRGAFEIVNALETFFSGRSFFEAIGSGIESAFDSIIEFFKSVFDPGLMSFMSGGKFLSAEGGIRFTGRDRGLAMLHEGEFVVPQSGQAPQQVQRRLNNRQAGPQIVINSAVVDSNAIDSLVRQIESRFGAFGASTSTLFGGV